MQDNHNERIQYLDVAKGIGILLMIFGHIDRGGIAQTWIYSFHMPMFFIISGILHEKRHKEESVDEYINKKSRSLLWPYFVLSTITLGYLFLLSAFNKNGFDLSEIKLCLKSTILFQGYGNLWFIPAFFGSNLFFCVFRHGKKELLYVGSLILCLIGSLICVLCYPEGNSQYMLDTVYVKSILGFAFVSFGFMLGKYSSYFEKDLVRNLILFVISCVGNILLFVLNGKRIVDLNTVRIGNPFFYWPMAILGSIAIISFSNLISLIKISKFFVFFGGGKRSLLFLAVNNFTIITAKSEKIVSAFLEKDKYPYYFVSYIIVLIIESFLVFVLERAFNCGRVLLKKRK